MKCGGEVGPEESCLERERVCEVHDPADFADVWNSKMVRGRVYFMIPISASASCEQTKNDEKRTFYLEYYSRVSIVEVPLPRVPSLFSTILLPHAPFFLQPLYPGTVSIPLVP